MQREASSKIVELLQDSGDTSTNETVDALKVRIEKLEKELETAQAGARESVGLERQLHRSKEEAVAWKNRFDDLFEMNKRTNRLIDINDALRGNGASHGDGVRNTIVHKMKPREPTSFDGSQDLEVVTRYLDEVEHYVRQGASMCPRATLDNQHIDSAWRFLSVKIFRWFQTAMKHYGLSTIPPADDDYGITWTAFKTLFREQFVPEAAVSVVRKQWHALRFSKLQVLQFNRRALELVEILGGSLSIKRENPLWEEYLRKLPEHIAKDAMQEAQIMRRVNKTNLSRGDMMEVVAERTLPFLPAAAGFDTSNGITSGTGQTPATATATSANYDPMDLSNAEIEDISVIDEKIQCHRCQGFGHIARQCGTPNPSNRAVHFKSRTHQGGGGTDTSWRQTVTTRQ